MQIRQLLENICRLCPSCCNASATKRFLEKKACDQAAEGTCVIGPAVPILDTQGDERHVLLMILDLELAKLNKESTGKELLKTSQVYQRCA